MMLIQTYYITVFHVYTRDLMHYKRTDCHLYIIIYLFSIWMYIDVYIYMGYWWDVYCIYDSGLIAELDYQVSSELATNISQL